MGLFEFIIEDRPVYSLSTAWEVAIVDYEDDFLDYWGVRDDGPPQYLEHDEWRRYRERYWLSQKLAKGAQRLVRPKRLPEDDLTLVEELRREAEERQETVDRFLGVLEDELDKESYWDIRRAIAPGEPSDPRTEHRFFQNCLEIEAVRLWGIDPRQMVKRMGDLLRYLLDEPGSRVRAYLSRVAECYVREMETEFAVMSRAVLEAALTDVMSDEDVRDLSGAEGHPGLASRINAAVNAGLLDADAGDAAFRVQRAGNDAVHGSPGLEPNLEELLGDMVRVVQMVES